MNRGWVLSFVCSVGCADVIGADFGGKTLEDAQDHHLGGAFGAGGDQNTGGTSSDGGRSSGGAHAGGSGNASAGGATSGGGTGGKGAGGTSAGGAHTGGTSTGGADTGGTGGASTGGTGTGGAATGGASTGGAATGGTGGGVSVSLVINEVYAEGSLDFIELFNTGSATIELAGYELVNGLGEPASSNRIALSGSVAPGKFKVEAEGCVVVVCDYFPFDIDTEGDTVWLLDGSGHVVDSVSYPDTDSAEGLGATQSYSRLPNGSGSFSAGKATKGTVNEAP